MATEIERKFLIKPNFDGSKYPSDDYTQAYLSSVPERSVRIRIANESAYLTIKGQTDALGLSRYEYEIEIDSKEAKNMLALCEAGMIEKTRYSVIFSGKKFEVDIFHGENEGLAICEIELKTEDEHFEKPDWLCEEVTGDTRFYNTSIAQNPFKKNPEF